jgi:cellulose synthase/poly-beta-1,6-N-acetylglucosamine synthase-like glycosyltransferase
MPLLTVGIVLTSSALAIVLTYLGWLALARPRPATRSLPCERPRPLIIVPVFDEAPLILGKLVNLEEMKERARVLIVDGGSTDGTLEIVRKHAVFELIETTLRNKNAQLREALRLTTEDWILVTDADALLGPDTLETLIDLVAADGSIGVAGADVRPVAAHPVESLHWRTTDWLRDREWHRGSAGIVAAPCYLAHRSILADLPADVIADDVHVACRAMLAGKRVGHVRADVEELRSPRTLRALLRHKFRKADAYLREIVRFLPLSPGMPRAQRAIFLWRASLLTLVPLLALLGALFLGIAVLYETSTVVQIAVAGAILLALTSRAFVLALSLAVVSAAALLLYPFSRQGASFPKILRPWEYQTPD